MRIEVEVPKKLPVAQLNRCIDRTVYNMASITLERSEPHIPYLKGNLHNDILARGVKGQNKTYTLGTNQTSYANIVWKYPQGTNWTNKKTYAQWFMKTFRLSREIITKQAVERAFKL